MSRQFLTATATVASALAAACTDPTHPAGHAPRTTAPRTAVTATAAAAGPELPRVYVQSDSATPRGRIVLVAAGGDLQAVINAAQPGDVIELAAGATYTGNFVLPLKATASDTGWITIRGGTGTTLPAAGQRVTPAHSANMPKLATPNVNPVLATAAGAHHYRLVGLEVTAGAAVTSNYNLIALGATGSAQASLSAVPHHLVLDRVYVHGHATLNFQRCVSFNSAHTAVVDSYLAQCHGRGFDSQAIAGWNGPGPFKIVNNHLEGAGENVMFGGSDPAIRDLVPSDIEIRRNHFYKPLSWKGVWSVKNLFELKNARRVLVEGNVFENNWLDAQDGFALVWKSVNQDGAAPWSTTSDVTFQYNVIRNVGSGLSLAARPEARRAVPAARFRIANNVFENVGGDLGPGRLWQISEAKSVELSHNTGVGPSHGLLVYGAAERGGIIVRDNVFGGGPGIVSGDGKGYGTAALDYHFPGWTVAGNLVIGAPAARYAFPAGNLYPSTAAEGGLSADLRSIIGEPAKSWVTTDRAPVGANWAAIDAKTTGVVSAVP